MPFISSDLVLLILRYNQLSKGLEVGFLNLLMQKSFSSRFELVSITFSQRGFLGMDSISETSWVEGSNLGGVTYRQRASRARKLELTSRQIR